MRISTRARYGIRLMIELASRYGRGPAFLKEIARSENISEKYLSQIVIPLRGKGLLTTFRGAHGGYVLSKAPSKISLRQIVEPLEGDLSLVDGRECDSMREYSSACVTGDLLATLGQRIFKFFESYTLEDLVRMREEKKDSLVAYNI